MYGQWLVFVVLGFMCNGCSSNNKAFKGLKSHESSTLEDCVFSLVADGLGIDFSVLHLKGGLM